MDKILITGGNGLVGSEFKGDQYLKPSSKEYDLKDKDQTYRLMLKGFDGIIHCAAKVGGVGANMNYKGEFFYDNIMINTNVIEGARLSGVKNLVAFLSTCIFPNEVDYPLTEKKFT
jgi:GDP-L-fucose synthase